MYLNRMYWIIAKTSKHLACLPVPLNPTVSSVNLKKGAQLEAEDCILFSGLYADSNSGSSL